MTAAGVVALEFVIDLCGCAELFLQTVGADKRRRTVHLIEIADFLRNLEVRRIIIQLLRHQLLAENAGELCRRHRLVGGGI